jgi:hypothetical protein
MASDLALYGCPRQDSNLRPSAPEAAPTRPRRYFGLTRAPLVTASRRS